MSQVSIRVPGPLLDLLVEVLEKRASGVLAQLQINEEVVLRDDQRRCIQELIGDELSDTGLRWDNEPNERGLALEKLIDIFSPYGQES